MCARTCVHVHELVYIECKLLTVQDVALYFLKLHLYTCITRVGQNHNYTVYLHTVFSAGKSPDIRSHTVHIFGSGQPYALYIRMIPYARDPLVVTRQRCLLDVGLARTIYIRCIYGNLGKEVTEYSNIQLYTVHIYGSGQP
jgi:hypothetical protein